MPADTNVTDPGDSGLAALAAQIRAWGRELGFQQVGIAGTALAAAEARLEEWLAAGFHGSMDYMARHGRRRSRPAELVPGTLRVISARMDCLPAAARAAEAVLAEPERGYVARYALGRDYHKVLRRRLARLAERITGAAGPHGCRVFTDSGPVLEKPLAAAAGLGWQGKHTNLVSRGYGSWLYLGALFTTLALPADPAHGDH